MTEPVSFTSTTPRHLLPLLFAGQAQKEFFVNQGLSQIDLLLHPSVEGERADPPVSPVQGECWLIGEPATGTWAGNEDHIAAWRGGAMALRRPQTGHDLA